MNALSNMVFASLIGDAIALGYHWIYDAADLKSYDDDFYNLPTPERQKYHTGKKIGQHTHYGDQTLWLLRSIASSKGFENERFLSDWTYNMSSYKGYLDHASKASLSDQKTGSLSEDLSGAARIAPIIFAHHVDRDKTVQFAVEQTAITHNSVVTMAAAEALVTIVMDVLSGRSPRDAIVSYGSSIGVDHPLSAYFKRAVDSREEDPIVAVGDYGQSCDIAGAFPSSLYLIMRYQDDMKSALINNVLAGGDQAARGLIIGMVLGASGQEIPGEWYNQYYYRGEVEERLLTISEGLDG